MVARQCKSVCALWIALVFSAICWRTVFSGRELKRHGPLVSRACTGFGYNFTVTRKQSWRPPGSGASIGADGEGEHAAVGCERAERQATGESPTASCFCFVVSISQEGSISPEFGCTIIDGYQSSNIGLM